MCFFSQNQFGGKMNKKSKIYVIALVIAALSLCCIKAAFTEPKNTNDSEKKLLDGFEFIDRDIDEILYTISLFKGISISADDTVFGKASFRFAGKDFDSAFDSFLKAERLYVEKKENSWAVSKVHFLKKENEKYTLDALDIKPCLLVEKISEFFSKEITFDMMPEYQISLHTEGSSAEDFAGSVTRQLGKDYSVEIKDEKIRISHAVQEYQRGSTQYGLISLNKDNSTKNYKVDVRESSISAVLEKLFACDEKEFILTCDGSAQIKRALFSNKTFLQTLSLLCEQAGLCAVEDKNIFYIVPNETGKNSLLALGKKWRKVTLSYKKASSAVNLVTSRFGGIETILLPDEKEFLCLSSEEVFSEISHFISAFDEEKKSFHVTLQFIHTSDLLSHLPPNVESSQIVQTSSDNMFFFNGSQKQYELFCSELSLIDKPVKRIRYDLLIMQYQHTNESDWKPSVSVKKSSFGDMNKITASLGSVLNFNLDVVTTFGLTFAASLQNEINENKAQVFVDTTLHGVSGGTINFKNTNTYRYRDNNIDPDTGRPIYTGITREIASGLKLDVTGWVSGDGMITSKVNAAVSRQGVDLSSSTGNPPPTSEKVITTEVRGKSGEPIVLSGLVQNENSFVENRVPFISKIPLIGKLFSSENKTSEKTELVIYLVPHWEKDENISEKNKILQSKDAVKNENTILINRLLEKYFFNKDKNNQGEKDE